MPVIVGEHSAYTRVSRRNKIILSKRESNNADRKQSIFETCGRTRRSAPTRRICPMVRDSKFGNGIFVTSGKRSIDIN